MLTLIDASSIINAVSNGQSQNHVKLQLDCYRQEISSNAAKALSHRLPV